MWKFSQFLWCLCRGRGSRAERDDCVQFTGVAPSNEAERLIRKCAGKRTTVPVRWLRRKICEELYRLELRKGGWIVDLAFVGPAGFGRDATEVLSEMRPEFGVLIEGEKAV